MSDLIRPVGPVDILVVGFPENRFDGSIAPAIADLVARGIVRVLDVVIISKDDDGQITLAEIADLDGDGVNDLAVMTGDIPGLIGEDDERAVADELPAGSTVAMIAWRTPGRSVPRWRSGRPVAWSWPTSGSRRATSTRCSRSSSSRPRGPDATAPCQHQLGSQERRGHEAQDGPTGTGRDGCPYRGGAGTATAVSGRVQRRQAGKAQDAAEADAVQQQEAADAQQQADAAQQASVDAAVAQALAAQQAQAAAVAAQPPAPAAGGGTDMIAQPREARGAEVAGDPHRRGVRCPERRAPGPRPTPTEAAPE